MRIVSTICFGLGFAATLLISAFIDRASAQDHGYRRAAPPPGNGYVVAQSRYGNATVRGAVRHTSLGRQVQLPGGSWVYCRRSCSETLRAETVDFWEAQQGPGGKEQGLFIYLRRW